MKKIVWPIVIAVATLTGAASATVIVYTGLEGYPSSGPVAGTASPQTGDVGIGNSGWAGQNWSWQGSGLSYTDANGTINGGNRALDYTGSNYQVRQVNVGLSLSIKETIYLRFLAQYDANLTTTQMTTVQLVINNDISNNNNNFFPGFGIYAGGPTRTDGTQNNHFFAAANSAGIGTSTLPTTIFGGTTSKDTTYLLVGRMTWDGSKFSTLDVWKNPTFNSGTPPAADASISIASLNITALTTLVVRGGATGGGPRPIADEIVIGTSWSDVVIIPEPATASLLLGAGALLLACRRPRRG